MTQPRLALPQEFQAVAEQWAAITGVEDSPALRDTVAARLEWWLGNTPNGRGALAVVEEGGKYLGVAGWSPKTLVVGAEKVAVAEIGTTMTAPDARGRGVFSGLVEFLVAEAAQRRIQALYGTPNAASGRPYLGKLNFKGVWPWSRWIRPVGSPAALAFDLAGAVRRGPRWSAPQAMLSVEICSDWDRLAECSASAHARGSTYIDRTADYLRWRYPEGRYRLWAARGASGALLGWVAVGQTKRLGRRTMSLAEIVVGPKLDARADGLLRSVLSRERQAAPDVRLSFAMTAPEHPSTAALQKAGFVARPSEWPLIARVVSGEANEEELFGPMSFTAGDSDTV